MEEVDKMSHRLRTCGAAAVLLLLLTLLSSCGQSAVQDETATDYNQYIPSHGVTAYTKDLYIFFDSGRLFYVGRSQPSQLFPLCFQADCDHKNSSCTAWLNTPSRSIYAAGDNLYYIDADKDAKPALYRRRPRAGQKSEHTKRGKLARDLLARVLLSRVWLVFGHRAESLAGGFLAA